jgi:hypothetical protein
MSFQEYKTAVEGQLYILNNTCNKVLIQESCDILYNIRESIVGNPSPRYISLLNTIDEAIDITPVDDESEPNSIQSLMNDVELLVASGMLSAIYSCVYYMWLCM